MIDLFRERVMRHLPKGGVARSIITLTSGTALAQGITICAMPMVTRMYSPAQVGLFSLFQAFFSLWSATLSLRYEYALLITKKDGESHIVKDLSLLLVFLMSVLGMPLLWALNRAKVLGFGFLPSWSTLMIGPCLFGYGVFMVYRSWALRAGLIKVITKASVARSGIMAGAQIGLGYASVGVFGLFVAQLAGSWAAMFRLMRDVGGHFASSKPKQVSLSDILQAGKRFAKFPLFEAPSTWIDQLGLALPVPMVAALHGATAAGWFGLARTIVGIPNSQIGSAVADVFQMELANAVNDGDVTRARKLFYKLLRKLAVIGLPPLVAVMTLGPWILPWIFGKKWGEAGLAAASIAPWLYAALIVSPLSRALSVLQAQEYKLVYDVLAVLFLGAAFYISKYSGYSFVNTVVAISISGVLGYVVYAVVLIFVVELKFRQANGIG